MARIVQLTSLPVATQKQILKRAFQFPMSPHPMEMALALNRLIYKYNLQNKPVIRRSKLFTKKLKGYIFIDGNHVIVFD